MLVELSIRDFALIDELVLETGAGLNAITGATGSGKSLLVTALEVLAGGRPRGGPREWVREGARRASVEGRFALPPGPLLARVTEWLAEHLPELLEDWGARDELVPAPPPAKPGKPAKHGTKGARAAPAEPPRERELLLARTLGEDGRTRATVNHRAVTQRALAELAALLFEIHGQNDGQLLFEPAEQLRLLDVMGELEGEVAAYRLARGEWRRAADRLGELEATRRERRNLLADLRFQANELAEAGIAAGERDGLRAERDVLRSAEDLARELGGWTASLSEGEDTAVDRLRAADRALSRWRERIGALAAPADELREALAHLEEACAGLVSFADRLEADPARLEEVEGRLAELDRLERKYGEDEAGLLRLQGELAERIAELAGAEESLEGLAAEVARRRAEVERVAEELSRARASHGERLAELVERALAELGMAGARFEVALGPRPGDDDAERFGPRGRDACELLLGANQGEPAKPLRHVASGGEAARVMLALRSVLSVGPAPAGRGERTLVFDEIDSGVGGHLAPKVAACLRALARGDQVLCVTHLPAIAAAADRHLKVSKEVRGGRSRTVVLELAGEPRVLEVADMIAGGAGHETARAEARRLLQGAR